MSRDCRHISVTVHPNRQRSRGQLRPSNVCRREVVVGFHLAGLSIRGPTARLEAVTVGAVSPAAAEHAVRLSAQKLRPRRADPPGRRPETRAAQHGRDRRVRDADPEFQQLALDAHVAPPRVLPRQPSDQATRLGSERGTTGPATATSATSRKQRSVPAAERLRADAKQDQRSGGSRRLAAASNARSAVVYRGRFPPRLRIASWWRSTTISSSRSPPPRASTPTRKHRSRYSKHLSTTRSLNRLDRDHQHAVPTGIEFLYPTAGRT